MSEDDILQFNIIVLSEMYYSDETTWGCFNFSTKDDIPYFVEPSKSFDPFKENHSDENVKISKLVGKMQHLVVGGEYIVKAQYKRDKNMVISTLRLQFMRLSLKREKRNYYF